MKIPIQQLARSPIVHALFVAAGTALVWLWDGIASSPILWDHAYFTVLSQGIVRGQPIYSTSFMGYPPFALLVSAAADWRSRHPIDISRCPAGCETC